MAETIVVELPRPGLRQELCDSLESQGLVTEVVSDGEVVELRVHFADEREKLVCDTAHAIEGWLAARELPFVVERADGGCLLRPPGD
ncbi:MAG TPA: hypothetical protein VF186_01505 [Gaiellaceae bacterium]